MQETQDLILFGSCNRQNLEQNHWAFFESFKASHFCWTGDSVYAKNNSLVGLQAAYDTLKASSEYQSFVASGVKLDGVWDDHDYGVNDGGKTIDSRKRRQEMFLNFIDPSHSDPILNRIRLQDGMYHYNDVKLSKSKVRIIFLDTRSFRDHHYIRSIGEYYIPLSAIAAACIRTTYSLLGLGRKYNGDVLGETQWQWLQKSLVYSDADFNIIVSSIQVLTSNPVVESWGHFPIAKRKLLDIILQANPRGLLLVSGDVHHAEISKADITLTRTTETVGRIVEVTSSGLTHSCEKAFLMGPVCPLMLRLFDSHRVYRGAFATHKNVAGLYINETGMADMKILGIDPQYSRNTNVLNFNFKSQRLYKEMYRPGDVNCKYADFPIWVSWKSLVLGCIVITFLIYVLRRNRALFKRRPVKIAND